ncbi:hypothetical protein [Vulcanisaeta sp. JCM 14467]|uniref:hypothetical protein n=1 Tax=Vulcanisaeta sp. JCM 14467 TaxID=1295370 RepID=UPI0006D25E33|nr:hypothetical protein [Vulcanisaeta sp. JCM 14467]
MIYKSLLPIIIALLVMISLTTYLINYVSNDTSKALNLENTYLLSINVIKQLNSTLPQILRNEACIVIMKPMNYSCGVIASNLTEAMDGVLNTISNKTGGIVRYRVIDYGVYGKGNATIYRAVIQVITQFSNVNGVVVATYPFNLCYYSQVISGIVNGLSMNVTIRANNITEAVRDISDYLMSRVGGVDHGIDITLRYIGVFRMIERTRNYTIYWGAIDYALRASPGEDMCNSGSELGGVFYVTVIINAYVNNTYYFAVSGVINNDRLG